MAAFSDYLELAIIKNTLKNDVSLAKVNLYIALIKNGKLNDAGGYVDDGGTAAEVTGGSYVRYTIINTKWDAATTDGVSVGDINTAITFVTATAIWGLIKGFGIYDALTNGNLYYHGIVNPNVQINSADTFEFADNALSITLD